MTVKRIKGSETSRLKSWGESGPERGGKINFSLHHMGPGFDATPLLPGGFCPIPHFGYCVRGRLQVRSPAKPDTPEPRAGTNMAVAGIDLSSQTTKLVILKAERKGHSCQSAARNEARIGPKSIALRSNVPGSLSSVIWAPVNWLLNTGWWLFIAE
jgi:hypothetical protein